jgi:hypothetical protein
VADQGECEEEVAPLTHIAAYGLERENNGY